MGYPRQNIYRGTTMRECNARTSLGQCSPVLPRFRDNTETHSFSHPTQFWYNLWSLASFYVYRENLTEGVDARAETKKIKNNTPVD